MSSLEAKLTGMMLYGALALGATPALAGLSADEVAALRAARAGDMEKLIIHDEPRPRLKTVFETEEGGEATMADFEGQVMLVNLWATWCPPCREEMPSIDRLKAMEEDESFSVAAIAMDAGSVEKIRDFLHAIPQADGSDYRADNLAIYREPTLRIGAEAAAPGLPVTMILDEEGREIARLTGGAEWDAPETVEMLRAICEALASEE